MKTVNVISSILMVGVFSFAAAGCYSEPPSESDEAQDAPRSEAQGLTSKQPTQRAYCSTCWPAKGACEFNCNGAGESYLDCFAACKVAYDQCLAGCSPDPDDTPNPCIGVIGADKTICQLWNEQ